ncbi:MAG: DM13 domain-containing protein [Acidimicrobiia bacterium]|nr:DM13 domain-containing protein [Acidimicrobiia bacterium]
MTKRTWILVAVVVGVPLIALAWWLGSPLILDTMVDEAFPMSAGAEVPEGMTQQEVEALMKEAADEAPTDVEESMPEGAPRAITSGQFTDYDNFHQGRGTATVYRLSDETRVLRFEDFEVTNGPDLHVLLVPHPNPGSREDLDGYVDLGPLKGNLGDQNYEIPGEVDISGYGSIVIYCVPFHVIFSIATLG